MLPVRTKGEKDMNEKKSRPMKWKPLKRIAGRMSPGLTLIEILIAIAILAIVVGIAYPSFQRLAINNYLKTAARDLASDIAGLKERSLAESRIHRLQDRYQQQQLCHGSMHKYGGGLQRLESDRAEESAERVQ